MPYEGSSLAGVFPQVASRRKGRAPTVVLFDGLDNCKEMSVLFAGVELAFRGFHTLAIDGPGQGEALRLRNLPSRYDYEVAGHAGLRVRRSAPDVDPKRVAIMAYSAGGYYAPRAAAFEQRYAACVAWGPHYDYHAVWQKRWAAMKKDHNSVATSHFQLPWVLGTQDMDSAMEKLKKFTLAGVAERITCPMLICWGDEDKLTPREVARPALRRRRLEGQDAEDLHRGGRRRRALPGRQPAGRHGLHLRLARGAPPEVVMSDE